MGAYGTPDYYSVNRDVRKETKKVLLSKVPRVRDYLLWIFLPIVLSIFTFGFGGLAFLIGWASDSSYLARANFARAMLVIICMILAVILLLIANRKGYIEFKTPWWLPS